MQIQINSDHSIEGREALAAHCRGVVEGALSHSRENVTRVEVHLSDQRGDGSSGAGGPSDMRCLMEARLAGRAPLAASHQAASLHLAIDGAADKLARAIDHALGRAARSEGHQS